MAARTDLFSPDVRRDPYPTYAELRASAAVQQVDPGGVWAVSRYEDAQFVFKHPELFSSEALQAIRRPSWLSRNPVASSILVKDGPGHAGLRALLSRSFSPGSVARLEPRVRAIASALSERLATLGQADFVAEFAVPLPARVICGILGLDPSLEHQFKRWANDVIIASGSPPATEDFITSVRKTIEEMEGYLTEIVALRRSAPGDDMVSDLVRAEIEGRTLTDDEIIAYLFLLLPAGLETTTHLLAGAMFAFLERPESFAALRADRSLVSRFVEELLRHDPPVHGAMRMAMADVEIGGVTVPEGAIVLVLIGSANRDGSRFSDPDRFDVERDDQSSLAFGHGAHYCLGAHLAKLEARAAIEALTSRFHGFERMPGEIAWNKAFSVRGPTTLPIRALPA